MAAVAVPSLDRDEATVRKSSLRLLLTCGFLLLAAAETRAEDWQRPALKGLTALRVSATLTNAPDRVRADTLVARTERRLRAAGIHVLSAAEPDSGPPAPMLAVHVAFARLTAEPVTADLVGYAFACGVTLSQTVHTMPGPAGAPSRPIVAAVWDGWKLGDADPGLTPAEAQRAIDDKLDEFVKDWAATHPGGAR